MQKTHIYTGIGARKTPPSVLLVFTEMARELGRMGYILRSGRADGADMAFENGADMALGKKEIFLPWKGFNGSDSALYVTGTEAYRIASRYHPYWHGLKPASRKLLGRDVHQILGQELDAPSDFLICWTDEGKGGGGTGMAIRIANAYGIPVFDAGSRRDLEDFKKEVYAFAESKCMM